MAPKAKKRGAGTASGAQAAKKSRPQVPSEIDDPLEDHGPGYMPSEDDDPLEDHGPRRSKKAAAVGWVYMLFRIFVVGKGYKTCNGKTHGHVADSRIHRFERLFGFTRDEQDDIDADAEAVRYHELLRRGSTQSDKYEHHATHQAMLER